MGEREEHDGVAPLQMAHHSLRDLIGHLRLGQQAAGTAITDCFDVLVPIVPPDAEDEIDIAERPLALVVCPGDEASGRAPTRPWWTGVLAKWRIGIDWSAKTAHAFDADVVVAMPDQHNDVACGDTGALSASAA